MRVDEDCALGNSTYVNNLLVDNLNISMETTDGDASCPNRDNKRNKRSIHNVVISGFIDSDQHENIWCCVIDTTS